MHVLYEKKYISLLFYEITNSVSTNFLLCLIERSARELFIFCGEEQGASEESQSPNLVNPKETVPPQPL